MKNVRTFFILLAFLGLSVSGAYAQKTYIITKSGSNFVVTIAGGETLGSSFATLQNKINEISINANGADCIIQFENGANVLDLGGGAGPKITFDNSSGMQNWGLITLTGKATSACTTSSFLEGIICTKGTVSIESKAELTATNHEVMLYHGSTGILTISSGTIQATGTDGYAVNNRRILGTLNITGGTIQATGTGGRAISNTGTANITGGTVTATTGWAIINDGTLNISGGMVQATGTGGRAVHNENDENVQINISGGTVQATGTDGRAVFNQNNLTSSLITISGGTIKATEATGIAIYNNYSGKITISGTAVVTSANTSAESGTIYLRDYGTNTDTRLEITGGTVENTATAGNAVHNNSIGAVKISGGTVKASGTNGMAIYQKRASGKIEINGGAVESKHYTIYNEAENGSITVSNGVVKANDTYGRAIRNAGQNSKITVSGGTIECGDEGIAIANASGGTNSEITVTGGTVSANGTNSTAIYNSGANSSVTVSGGTVKSIYRGIYNDKENSNITIAGGRVENTAASGFAVWNNSTGKIDISGGTILAKQGTAVFNNSTGTLDITGGISFAYGTGITDVIYGSYTISNGIIAAWNEAAGKDDYVSGTSEDIFKFPEEATAVWAKQSSDNGISASYKTTTGFIPVEGVTVGTTGIEQLRNTNYELRVFPNPTNGQLKIENGELKIENVEIYDVHGRKIVNCQLSTVNSINISHLSRGTYFLKMQTASGELVQKLIKE